MTSVPANLLKVLARTACAGLAVAPVVCVTTAAFATEYMVSSASQISTAMNSAGPGDTLIMTDGVWTNQHIDFAGDGTAANPIILRAQTPGGVTLNGDSTLSISGDWLVADGLNFDGGALAGGGPRRALQGQ